MSIFSKPHPEFPAHALQDLRIAILATHGFEASELFEPLEALRKAGARVDIVSPETGKIRAWTHGDWGKKIDVDVLSADANARDYDGLVLPGGVLNPDALRIDEDSIAFIQGFVESGKPIAAICHGVWPLIDADGIHGRTMTSWASLKADLINAGAHWVDEPVVVDHGLVTSRKPADLPLFIAKMIEEFKQGPYVESTEALRQTAPPSPSVGGHY